MDVTRANRDHQTRYIVRDPGGTAMRWFDQPLTTGTILTDMYGSYQVVKVEQPKIPGGLGHAWCDPIEPP